MVLKQISWFFKTNECIVYFFSKTYLNHLQIMERRKIALFMLLAKKMIIFQTKLVLLRNDTKLLYRLFKKNIKQKNVGYLDYIEEKEEQSIIEQPFDR